LYFCFFSILILCFLWLFQVLFLDSYYEWVKTKQIHHLASDLKTKYQNHDWENLLDEIAYEKGICIEIATPNQSLYSSTAFNRGCMINNDRNGGTLYKNNFIKSGRKKKIYTIENPRFHNKTILYAIQLDLNTYGFISASLEPLDEGARIIKSQLFYVSIGVLLLSFLIGYFLSKRISSPIVKINQTAKDMSKGNYDIVFQTEEDIDEINELVATLNQTKEELSKTETLRRDLMANVGHDLKTPLTMMKAYAEMVRDLTYQDDIKRVKNCNVIIEETDRLTMLVNDIIELSELQSQVLELKLEPVSFKKIIQSILKRYDIYQEKEGIRFILEETEEDTILADQKKLEQVIYNLLNNALNYIGEDKTIIIRCVDQNTTVRLEIEDHGSGIQKKDLDHIWDRYYKDSKKHKRNTIGTGIGLSIVKNICMHHHFQYGVTSKKGKGTIFYLEAPKENRGKDKKK